MNIKVKLLSGFVGIAALTVILGLVSWFGITSIGKNYKEFTEVNMSSIMYLQNAALKFSQVKADVRTLLNPLNTNEDIERQFGNIEKNRASYKKGITAYESVQKVPQEEKLYKEMQEKTAVAAKVNNQIIEAARDLLAEKANKAEIYSKLNELAMVKGRTLVDEAISAAEKLIDFNVQYYAKDDVKKNLEVISKIEFSILVTMIISLILAISLGMLISSRISRPIRQIANAANEVSEGRLNIEPLDITSTDETGKLATCFNKMITNLKQAQALMQSAESVRIKTDIMEKISCGDLNVDIKLDNDSDILGKSMIKVVENLKALVADANMLAKAGVEGKLQTRADTNKHQGDYKKIVEGVNQTLDSVIIPLNVAADYVDKISKGNIPPKITDSYNGDFNIIKNNLNACIDAVNLLVSDTVMLVKSSLEGKLQARADANQHQGDFKKIINGINETLNIVIKPVNQTIEILEKMAEGNLTERIKEDYKGDFERLKNSLNSSLNSINEILAQVNKAISQVAAGSKQVSSASQSLSQGAAEQASSLEEITSSLTEIYSQTKQNTEIAVQMNGLSQNARENAGKGNEQMKGLVSSMTDINKSSEDIKKIVKTIDDIAFQINLLALNANVEAARAGKYGKGFAVVAEEVRNLAVRSARAVKETTVMVEESIKNINQGNNFVQLTAKQLEEIFSGSSKVADLAEEVAIASKEQSKGIEQVNIGLGQIDQVTQSNTASAEESASASEELAAQAQQLKGMVGKFKLSSESSLTSNTDKTISPELLQIIRDEMSKLGTQYGNQELNKSISTIAQKTAFYNDPRSLIKLEDEDFGKF